jgi:hypothetical protein
MTAALLFSHYIIDNNFVFGCFLTMQHAAHVPRAGESVLIAACPFGIATATVFGSSLHKVFSLSLVKLLNLRHFSQTSANQ